MPRVVVKTKDSKLEEAAMSCPCNCFRKNSGEFVIDASQCIDCGVCQTIVDEGVILEDSEADSSNIEYNNSHAGEWESAQ
ncbi:MAG: hypothetical protein IJ853_02150 [Rickettsiales bacterium]|nr:hypothetical protein [Rickettsiales bacterium]